MGIQDLLGRASDLYFELRFPGWNEVRESAEAVLPSSERHEARRILYDFASQVAQNGKKPILCYYGIHASLKSAKSLPDLEQRCSVMGKMSGLFDEESWWTACARGSLKGYVDKALGVLKEHKDFSLTYIYTPPEPYTYMTTEEIEYGGTGCNAYRRETNEVERTDYSLEKLAVTIIPLD